MWYGNLVVLEAMVTDLASDEILQLIFYELHDPGAFSSVSKRLFRFTQDPYTRAHYFLNRYGPAGAIFEVLGRGKIVNERILDVCMRLFLSFFLRLIAMDRF